jgi:hypothetical protein
MLGRFSEPDVKAAIDTLSNRVITTIRIAADNTRVVRHVVRNHNEAQRAPSARPGFADVSCECAQLRPLQSQKPPGFRGKSSKATD